MKFAFSALGAAAGLAGTAYSHAIVTSVLVNDVDQGMINPPKGLSTTPGVGALGYVRVPFEQGPVKDYTSTNLTCNTLNVPAPNSVSLNAGDKLTMQWHHDNVTETDDIINSNHKGPILTYMAPSGTGAGDVWVKVAEEGYNPSTKTWAASDNLISRKGKSDIIIPATLAPGDYLVRQEFINLQEANVDFAKDPSKGAQFYLSCVQVTIKNGGTSALPAGVAIPGVYKFEDVKFNLGVDPPENFKIPGPAIWSEAGGHFVYNYTKS